MLVIGGTGTFGRAFVRRMINQGIRRVCVYSRDEHKQAQMRDEFGDEQVRYFIGDVRDYDRLEWAMRHVEYVIHAAALKRIEVGHYNPTEMVETNVIGTMNVVKAVHRNPYVKSMVYLSSDKAYQPVSAYGQSKALAESVVIAANNADGPHKHRFRVTRYGNVSGSNGSVIPKWRELKAQGRRVQITDPDCTRFWMTIEQAVDLVVESMYRPIELNIPNLPAYRLGDLAEAMEVEADIIGLPPHEKKHESMRDDLCSKDARRMSVAELRGALKFA